MQNENKYHHHHQNYNKNTKHNHPKRKKEVQSLHFLSVCGSIPHPDKRYKHGEDASFQTTRSLGVFDGVGSWNDEGVDPGKYSKKLASIVKHRVQDSNEKVSKAVEYAINVNKLEGSSTVCVAETNGRRLKGINIGDSGLLVIRKGELVFKTKEQNHGFNHPYQVSYKDRSDFLHGEHINFELREGDIVILASDGVFDNVFLSDIIKITGRHYNKWMESGIKHELQERDLKATRAFYGHNGNNLRIKISEENLKPSRAGIGDRIKELTFDLAGKACTSAHHRSGISPFTVKASKANENYSGGKMDDITIVVGIAVSNHDRYRASIEAICPGCSH